MESHPYSAVELPGQLTGKPLLSLTDEFQEPWLYEPAQQALRDICIRQDDDSEDSSEEDSDAESVCFIY